jgi:undecaprenyl-diphosphatase
LARSAIRSWLTRLQHRPFAALVAASLAGAAFLTFGEIADEVSEQETSEVDRAILLAMRSPDDVSDPIGPPWLEEVGRDLTALGGNAVGTLFTLAAGGYLWLAGKRATALLLVGAIASGELLSYALKGAFHRPRPDLVTQYSIVYTSSFPSGHSMFAAIAYLTAGALIARAEPRKRVKAFVMALAVLLTFVTGVSRVYLGVHWPSDVLAGWLAGAGWAAVCWAFGGVLQHRSAKRSAKHGATSEPEQPEAVRL